MHQYEVVIIGGGQAGVPLAFALASAGKRTALIERKHLGGSCVNFGCTPTKAAIASARVAHLARRAAEYGVIIPSVEVDFPRVLQRAEEIAARSRLSLEHAVGASVNLELLSGHARFVGRDGDLFLLSVGERRVSARNVVLDTGRRADLPGIEGIGDLG